MIFLTAMDFTLPLADPVLKFLIILLIILGAPLLLNKIRIPPLLGLIIAGAVIGPHGFNLVLRDSSIILSGTAGLLYIMFLAGLEIDMGDFKRNSLRSLTFGLYTFCVPMALGIVAGYYLLGFSWLTSVLLASMFASHTLIAYPIISKLGISKNNAVCITVGGTMITDTLALLVLTIVVALSTGNADDMFWVRLGLSIMAFTLFVLLGFPLIGRWFFKRVHDNISQYIFVLAMVFLGAYLAHMAGLEPIIGAFLSGLALNRQIPRTSPLMNRIEFVGNAIFIPFFLIGVGMLIDYRAFFRDWESIEVALVMIALITLAKFLAAYFTQKTFRLSNDQRTVIFGLSSAHVAATLAAVMVGYNVILGHTADGEPIRLLSESVLNGTILMILATCTVSTFATQRGAHNIAMRNAQDDDKEPQEEDHILIPLANEQTAYELVCLSMTLKKAKERNGLYALNAIDNKVEDPNLEKQGRKLLDMAAQAAASADNYMQQLLRYDVNIANAIVSVVKERNISDIVMGMHHDRTPGGSGIGRMAADLLGYSNVTTFFYHPEQPLTTVKRHLVIVPEKAEKEAGFQLWMQKLRNLAENSSARIVFYAPASTMQYLRPSRGKRSSKAEYVVSDCWDDLTALTYETKRDDCLWVVMSRRDRLSYHPAMSKVPGYMEQFFAGHSFVLIYPVQAGDTDNRYL